MITRTVLPFAFTMLLTACGSSGSTSSAGSGGGGTGGSSSGGIPAPGSSDDVDNDFMSVEPNNTPSQATPLGQAMGADVYVWVGGNTIGGAKNDADYFVFESGSKAGSFSLGMSGLCWNGGITNLSATLWKVSGGQEVTPPVHTWNGTDKCVTSAPGDAALDANTEYLLGVMATGGSGTYSA